MKIYTYSEARQRLSDVVNESKRHPVGIRRRGGEVFRIVHEPQRGGSPLDVPGVDASVTLQQVIAGIRISRKA